MKVIYIADDEKDILLLLESFLKKEGYRVVSFETGDELWEVFQKAPADLVISDLMMPGTNGLLIVNQIRSISKIPIIVLTARDSDSDFIAGFSMGCDDYFTKPFSVIKLILRVRAIFSREELLDKIWGVNVMIETRATDDVMKRLRKKLKERNCSVCIETVWGYGFKIKEA